MYNLLYNFSEGIYIQAISYSQARQTLAKTMTSVVENYEPVLITRTTGEDCVLKDIQRTPFEGIGKSESLKFNLSGFWSRRIDEKHRLVYAVTDEAILIASCRYHY